jgi:hypothetical protein
MIKVNISGLNAKKRQERSGLPVTLIKKIMKRARWSARDKAALYGIVSRRGAFVAGMFCYRLLFRLVVFIVYL